MHLCRLSRPTLCVRWTFPIRRPTAACASLSRYTTEEQIDYVIREVPPIIAQLRKLSPYWSGNGPAEAVGDSFEPVYA